ncbi:MAG: PilZ domain-containing protein [Anaerolineales bacterium]|nr:PilZ domain-containing protein [Anaerolineales bacterium]
MNEKVLPFFPYSNVILRSDALPYPLKARVKEIDFSKKSAMLDHLEYIYEDLGSRSEVRVEPQEDLHITITDDQLHVLPCLAIDLSINGLSVLVEKKDISHLHDHLPDDKTLRVTFSLPEMDDLDEQQVSFLARMVYELEADNGFRVGLKIYPTSMDLIKLQRYIHALHTDTIQNIMKKES